MVNDFTIIPDFSIENTTKMWKSHLTSSDLIEKGTLGEADPADQDKPYKAVRDKVLHWPGHPAPAPPGSVSVCPSAGSFVVMTENTTHGTVATHALPIAA